MLVKGKFSAKMDIFYFLLGCVKSGLWQPEATLNPLMHTIKLQGQEWRQWRTVGITTLHEILLSAFYPSQEIPLLPQVFLFLLAHGLTRRQCGVWQGECP